MGRIFRIAVTSSVFLLLFVSLMSCGRGSEKKADMPASTSSQAAEPTVKPWKVVGSQGVAQFVYVESENAHDGVLMAQILQAVVGRKSDIARPVQVMFFDKESETPVAFPITDSQMLHQVAQYNYNPNTSFEEFVWLTVSNSKASPPEFSRKTDSISPGVAP